ncbi:PilZ domain-containing protein [uncultured Erythrobacter sp.]|uniref:PilZ domain-containing protein n=1 Tax=uncultured Erythrobacter sp. TaxID=263913 RepID=UPI00261F505B|nr:PilZ domain-containing protein [uncultured Erythrobacter sp.]
MAQEDPSRTSNRRPLHLMIKGRVQSRAIYADLIDISEGGCKLRASSGFASVGDRVTMRLNGINAPLGKVVWIEGKVAGVAFESRMHVAVLDYLCASVDEATQHERQTMHRM